jgi:hypothetical protein
MRTIIIQRWLFAAGVNRSFRVGMMLDKPDSDPTPGEQAEPKVSKLWHAPQFIAMDLTQTDTSTHAATDGGPMGSHS